MLSGEVEENGEESRGVSGSERQICIVDEKPSALTILLFQRPELPGAENPRSENTSPTVEKALMLESPPTKSMSCWCVFPCKRRS